MRQGQVFWITGLSGAGKSTLACEIVTRLKEKLVPVVHLDGDQLRAVFGVSSSIEENHGRAARLSLAMRYAQLCSVISLQGVTVVISTISLFHEVHAWNRSNLPDYVEIYLKVPVEELRRRDSKDIYRRYDSGELSNVAGLDLSIDEPVAPDWIAEFIPGRTVEQIADALFRFLNEYEAKND